MTHLSSTEIASALREVVLFSALSASDLEALLRVCRTQDFAPGSRMVSPSQTADRFFVILRGKVKVFKLSPRGQEQILHLYGPGRTFGEAAMWAEIAFPAFAEAVEPTTLLVVSRSDLRALIQDNPDLSLAMMAGLSAKLREFNALIEQISLREVPARLAAVLVDLARKTGGTSVRLEQTKRELAAQIGTVAETLSRAFRDLRTRGLIEVKGSEIVILDGDALAALAVS